MFVDPSEKEYDWLRIRLQEEMTIERNNLSPNARRWLDRALPPGTPIPAAVTNTQKGEMDVRGRWTPFTATTSVQAQPFSFLWRARLRLLPGVWVTAEDGHDGSRGWGHGRLWGLLPMGRRDDPEVFRMQLVRSLAELPWQPHLAFAIPGLSWRDGDGSSFTVRATFGGEEVTVRFDLNSQDDVVGASARRPYDVPDGFRQAPWRYDFADHQELSGLRVPTSASATYEKEEGPWTYWRGWLTALATGDTA